MGPDGLTVTPQVTPDPSKPADTTDVQLRQDTGGRTQVRLQVAPPEKVDPADPKPEAKKEDAPKPDAPARPEWLPEKFKTPEDLKNATIELAKKQGAPAYVIRGIEASESGAEVSAAYADFEKKIDPNAGKPAAPKPEPKQKVDAEGKPVVDAEGKPVMEDAPAPVVKSEADKTYERETFGVYVAEMLDKVGIRAVDLGEEFTSQGNKLSDATYEKFAKAGVAKPFLDAYIAGMVGNAVHLAEAGVKEAKDSIGGEAEFNKIAVWASANLTKEQHETYTVMTNSGSLVAAKQAVKMLKGWYDEANGKPPKLVTNTVPSTSSAPGYGSRQEMEADMRDPRYKAGDKAFHKKVEEKLINTNL